MSNIGTQIRSLLSEATTHVILIAPFIKEAALDRLMTCIPDHVPLHCVTRWLPKDIAANVSDVSILTKIYNRPKSTLTLVDNLHAKMYIADDQCLVGSANVTLAGFGENAHSNLEILVQSPVDNPEVSSTLAKIRLLEYEATEELASRLQSAVMRERLLFEECVLLGEWIPVSLRPEQAYDFYTNYYLVNYPDSLKEAERAVLRDITTANLMPGKSQSEFDSHIRDLLRQIPKVDFFLQSADDQYLVFSDFSDFFSKFDLTGFSQDDLWRSLVKWIDHFFPEDIMAQEISELSLRRARRL